ADVIAVPGNTQAATGSAANMSARAETATLINSFNITSLSTTDSKTQQAGKGFSLLPSPARGNAGCDFQPCRRQRRTESGLSERPKCKRRSPSLASRILPKPPPPIDPCLLVKEPACYHWAISCGYSAFFSWVP